MQLGLENWVTKKKKKWRDIVQGLGMTCHALLLCYHGNKVVINAKLSITLWQALGMLHGRIISRAWYRSQLPVNGDIINKTIPHVFRSSERENNYIQGKLSAFMTLVLNYSNHLVMIVICVIYAGRFFCTIYPIRFMHFKGWLNLGQN